MLMEILIIVGNMYQSVDGVWEMMTTELNSENYLKIADTLKGKTSSMK